MGAQLRHLAGHFFGRLADDVVDQHGGRFAFAGQPQCDRPPDAGTGSGNQGNSLDI